MIENKPITLLTGLPGAGKTALGVNYLSDMVEAGRPIFQTGIPELKLPHAPVPPIEEWTELRPDPDNPSVMCPYFTFPPNSVIFLSEAQRWYRPRPSGAKVPDHVAAFETVRHTGVTFVFDTQHPDFIDSHVRKLVGQHVHLLDHGVMGRWHYEWPHVGRPEDYKNAPIKKKYSLPKKVFGLYKSSSLHIKRKYTIPPVLILAAVLIVAIAFYGYRTYSRISGRINPTPEASASASPTPAQSSAVASGPVTDPAQLLMEFVPRVPGRPETAPAYDTLRQVKNMPVVVGCIKTAKACRCSNQQGLDAGLDNLQCENWIRQPPFNAYLDQPAPVSPAPQAAAHASTPTPSSAVMPEPMPAIPSKAI